MPQWPRSPWWEIVSEARGAWGRSGARRVLRAVCVPFLKEQELGLPEGCGPGFDLAVQVGQTWVQVF